MCGPSVQPLRKFKLCIYCSTPEAIACLVFELSKSIRFSIDLMEFLRVAMYILKKEAEVVVIGTALQNVWIVIFCKT